MKMNKLLFYGQIWLLTHQKMTEVFPFYFNKLSLKNKVNSKEWLFLLELKDRVVGSRLIFAYLIYFLFARIDANQDYTFIPKISKIRSHDDDVIQVVSIKQGKLSRINSSKIQEISSRLNWWLRKYKIRWHSILEL